MSKQKANEKEADDNVLANWLGKVNESIEPHSKLIAVVVGALIIGLIGWGFYSSKTSGDRSDATYNLLMSQADVDDNYPGTPAAAWSVLNRANQDLDAGIQSLYSNRSDAETLLNQCKSDFKTAMSSSEDQLLKSRAQLGIALASESLGELDDAIQAYESLISINESDAMNQKAQGRIDELSRPDTKEFVAWFAKQDFTPAEPSMPPELPGGATLPDMPDLKLPTLGTTATSKVDGDDAMDLEDKEGGIELPNESPTEEAEKATDAANQAAEKMQTKAVETTEAAKETTDTAKETTDTAKETTDTVKATTETVKETTETAKEVTETAKEAMKETVEAAKETAGSAAETVTEGASGAVDATKQTIEAAKDAAKGAADGVKEGVKDAVKDVVDAAKDAVK